MEKYVRFLFLVIFLAAALLSGCVDDEKKPTKKEIQEEIAHQIRASHKIQVEFGKISIENVESTKLQNSDLKTRTEFVATVSLKEPTYDVLYSFNGATVVKIKDKVGSSFVVKGRALTTFFFDSGTKKITVDALGFEPGLSGKPPGYFSRAMYGSLVQEGTVEAQEVAKRRKEFMLAKEEEERREEEKRKKMLEEKKKFIDHIVSHAWVGEYKCGTSWVVAPIKVDFDRDSSASFPSALIATVSMPAGNTQKYSGTASYTLSGAAFDWDSSLKFDKPRVWLSKPDLNKSKPGHNFFVMQFDGEIKDDEIKVRVLNKYMVCDRFTLHTEKL
ncbi:putative lipoprotein [Teredinibacter turnerae T7901]|uniref:Lipoprotein n=1 Tax=Teredinibacter turnerae (strain ATCC 39867 / T7901) TaxID=377629 RepID=C5BS41_TERTT|nr:hypothetical protein [Teredinibacter turnerae]ACR11451.1 putative lipoprotein [Teredinibacter turnerae T7901]